MLIDARQQPAGKTLETEICIIGAGAAGITMALEFERAGIDCILLESGGEVRDEATSDLYRGESVGLPYDFADGSRSRFLGGSSNCWGGFCRPWDQDAFEHRDWVNASGWPIGRADLDPFYTRAHRVLKVPAENYRPGYWVDSLAAQAESGLKADRLKPLRLPLDASQVEDIVSHFSPPLNLGREYRPDLAAARHVSLMLWANVVDIQCNPWGSTVELVRVKTLSGSSFAVKARTFVLAAGGIENARLLLASNRQQAAGVGNRYDLVGRYFQDHPRFFNGSVEFTEPYRHNPLYDIKFHCIADDLSIGGARLSGQLRLPFEIQRRECLLDAQVWFRSLYPGEGDETVRALYRLRQRLRRKWSPTAGLPADLAALVSHPLDATLYTYAHTTGSRQLVRSVAMEMIAEPEPDADCRVTLSDEVDALGMRRSKIDWRLSKNVVRTVDRTFELIARELRSSGAARVKLDPPIAEAGWSSDLEGTYHHMGATRMHDSPRMGVVDRNCQLHGVGNFYIAGSSVFPTSSSNHPTMTLIALALRLSDRLTEQVTRRASNVPADQPSKALST